MSGPNSCVSAEAVMADVHSAFNFDTAPCKRKRGREDLGDDFLNRDVKRRSTHALPIRLSPSRPQISVPPAFPMFTSIYQQPPTPVDTSDDESLGHPKDEHGWSRQPSSLDDGRPGGSHRVASIKAEHADPVDVDMDLNPNPNATVEPRIRRARSNDIIAPYRDSNLLNTMEISNGDRIPTPINSHFDNRLNDLPGGPRHHFPPLHTNLSPMLEQESWISRDGLPSPTEDQEMDTAMMLDQVNNGTGRLHVSESNALGGQLLERHGPQPTTNSSPGHSRTAKLHMGFLSGCEKCSQKVPGHYSHILWT